MSHLDRFIYAEQEVPAAFFEAEATELADLLGGPTLFFFPGETERSLLITVLLHGNETSGFYALRDLLRDWRHAGKRGALGLHLFVGNVHAAKAQKRRLSTQPDFNRIWYEGSNSYCVQAMDLVKHVMQGGLDCAVDFHNNTGRNPLYSCMGTITGENCALAYAFSPIAVHFGKPIESHAIAFAQHTRAVTFECGVSGQPEGYAAARALAERLLMAEPLPSPEEAVQHLRMYESQVRVLAPAGASVSFDDAVEADFNFRGDLDELNFAPVSQPVRVGRRKGDVRLSIDAPPAFQHREYFRYEGRDIFLLPEVTPSMFTTDALVACQDCVGYLMHPVSVPERMVG